MFLPLIQFIHYSLNVLHCLVENGKLFQYVSISNCFFLSTVFVLHFYILWILWTRFFIHHLIFSHLKSYQWRLKKKRKKHLQNYRNPFAEWNNLAHWFTQSEAFISKSNGIWSFWFRFLLFVVFSFPNWKPLSLSSI